MNRNIYLLVSIFLIGILISCDNKAKSPTINKNVKNTKDNIVFALPFAPVSYPVLKMMEDKVFENMGMPTELIVWSNPDQLKSLLIGEKADFYATASNTAATFYNKGVDVKLLNISVWRLIWIISRDSSKTTLEDFKGEQIAMPFKGDMPHIVFNELAKKQGMNPEKDFDLVFEPHPMDAAQKLIMRRIDHAVLVDPAASMVLTKSKSGPMKIIAPDLFRTLDFQDEWAKLFNTKNEIPYAGIIAGSTIMDRPDIIDKFSKEYAKANEWCVNHPEETGKIIVKYIPQLNEKGIAEAMRHVKLKAVDGINAKESLEKFYRVLMNSKPGLVGGKLPDSGFYYNSKNN